ncbi:DDT domain-containing protein DDR4 isoform X2 [Raphanus sativus]|nr:DDT domain-containing protein DDR4 isoform X2 [Raphanus sativus]
MGLIDSDATNAQLHIALLKGIPPVNNKSLEDGDAWITVLCKKLDPWWPLIANGEIPVTANKGEEISGYKGLDPTDRLQFLKALCELRAQQDDARKYIQDNANEGTINPCFGKRKLGGDGKKTSYWFDGNDTLGYRLYKEVNETSRNVKARKNVFSDTSCFCWETEATNLDEFQRVARELSSSKPSSLAAVGAMIESDAIPVVEKYHKKKEREIKKKMKQEMVVSVNISRPIRFTRSCRNRKPATYTFEEYDKMITDAVEDTYETDRDGEEGTEQQSASLLGSNGSSEDNKMKSTEDVPKTGEEAPESDKDDVKEMEKRKEDSAGQIEFGAKNRMRQRLTRNSALC